jgi:serine/threonine-protein kinase
MAPPEPEHPAPDETTAGHRDVPSKRWADVERLFDGSFEEHYLLEREIGRGGMAIVYLARDLRHDRLVAIKVLAPERADWGSERFLREIRFAARLTHPHILGVHDSGEAEGLLYYVMPYVEGESLHARLRREGALPLPDALQLLRELADALAYAHEHGVVHRDLKPENVLLSGGHAVIADFGIAKAVAAATTAVDPEGVTPGTRLTSTGMAIGTPAYMAPEQAVGDAEVDHRADLYALGMIAYEVISGAHPFGTRSPQALVAAHLTEQPAPVTARRAGVPAEVADIVMRLLAKDPAMRPQSAREVLRALGVSGTPVAVPRRRPSRIRLLAAALISLLVLGALAWRIMRPPGARAGASAGSLRTVAVLPFVNTSGDPADDYFSDGLTDELAQALRRLPGLSVAGRVSSYTFKGKSATAQEIGRALDVSAIVTGTVQRSGERLRVRPQFVSTRDGRVVWDSTFESRSADVFAVQDQFTRATIAAVLATLGGPPPGNATGVARGTSSQEAYDLYLKGRYYWMERGVDNLNRSIQYFTQAVDADPSFARAYAGLALVYGVYDVYQAGGSDTLQALLGRYAREAVALDSTDADGMVALASWLEREGRHRESDERYRAAIRLDPSNPTTHHWYGFSLLSLGRTDEAVAELRQAVRLDPLSKSPAATYVATLVAAHQLVEARAEVKHVLALDSLFPLTLWSVAQIHLLAGHPDSAASTLETVGRLYPDAPGWRSQLLLAYAAAGRWTDAERMRQEVERLGKGPASTTERALVAVAWGNADPLISLLQRDDGRRAWMLAFGYVGCHPLLDLVRNDPRFRSAMRNAGITECHPAKPFRLPAPPDS